MFVNKTETQLTPCRRYVLDNLTVTQLVKKLRAFCGTRLFITIFTRAHQLSRSWSIPVWSTPASCFWRYILILSPTYF